MNACKYLMRKLNVDTEIKCYSCWKQIPTTRDTIFSAIEKVEQIIKEDDTMIEGMIFELIVETDDRIVYEPKCRWIKPYYNKQVSFSADTYCTKKLTLMSEQYISLILSGQRKE